MKQPASEHTYPDVSVLVALPFSFSAPMSPTSRHVRYSRLLELRRAGTPPPQGRTVYAFEDEDGNGGSGHVCAKTKKCER